MAVNLSKNGPALTAAYKEVVDEKSSTNWALFTYEGNSNDIRLAEKGDPVWVRVPLRAGPLGWMLFIFKARLVFHAVSSLHLDPGTRESRDEVTILGPERQNPRTLDRSLPLRGDAFQQSNKVPVVQHAHHIHPLSSLISYSNEHFSPGTPPGHLSPEILDPKTGIPRTPHPSELSPYYPLSPGAVGQLSHPLGWLVPQQGQPMYSIPPGGFRHPYPALAMNASMSSLVSSRFSPHMVTHSPHGLHQTGIPHPAIVSPAIKQEPHGDHISPSMHARKSPGPPKKEEDKKPHIKKPLNAFMLYMKEMRAKVVAECTLKESAAINQILGRRWHSLSREEQAKYYELARKERQLHSQLYPGWSARDNYGKRKKRKRDNKPDSTPEDFSIRNKKQCVQYLPPEKMCDSPASSHGSMLDSPATPSAALASPAAPAATHSEQAQPLSLTTKPEGRMHQLHHHHHHHGLHVFDVVVFVVAPPHPLRVPPPLHAVPAVALPPGRPPLAPRPVPVAAPLPGHQIK
ncbi:unnamed protein product [Arctogadus glacialis]